MKTNNSNAMWYDAYTNSKTTGCTRERKAILDESPERFLRVGAFTLDLEKFPGAILMRQMCGHHMRKIKNPNEIAMTPI